MLLEKPDEKLYEELVPLLAGLGIQIVDVGVRKKDGSIKVFLVLWSDQGMGIDQCAQAHRLVQPKLELVFDSPDVGLEVSSPGLERVIKYRSELRIFQGRKVKLWSEGNADWTEGLLGPIQDDAVVLTTAKGELRLPLATLQKAKLNDI